jgi:DNA repair exonuclease SbcCD ATPase subunit
MFQPVSLKIKNILSYEEQEFKFQNGKAIIVVGDNRDDPGQRGNGSGKSGINEAIVIALTGDTIRKVKKAEIVRRGCDSGEVELVLYNAMYRCDLKIVRKIYSGSKSGEYAMFENGKDQKNNYSDPNTFNAFIWKMLGISKEDFFNFYVITKEYYIPFLSVGDTEKKKVVNRFSGANKVDNALPYVEEDIEEKQKHVDAIDDLITGILGKQELLGDQIKREEEKSSIEAIEQEKIKIDEQIKDKVNDLNAQQKEWTEEVELLDKEKKDLKKLLEFDKSEDKAELQNGITETRNEIKALSIEIKKLMDDKSEARKLKVEQEVLLAGTIKCPKCDHEFAPFDEEYDIETGRTIVKSIDEEVMPAIDKQQADLEQKREEYDTVMGELEEALDAILTEEKEHDRTVSICRRNINAFECNIKQKEGWLNAYQKQIDQLTEKKKNLTNESSKLIDSLSEQLMGYIDEETNARERLEKAVEDKQQVEEWLTHFKSFKSFLANKSIKNIQDYTNMYLQAMGTNISIAIDGYRVLANKKLKEEITTSVMRNGFEEGSYGTFSAGERGRIDIAVILAIQTLINLNAPSGGIDLLICDEIMDSVDSLGLESIVGALQNVNKTVMIVSQNEINSLSEYTITIRKQNRISTIICQNTTLGLTLEKMEESQSSIKKTGSKQQQRQQQEEQPVKKLTNKLSSNSSKSSKKLATK